MKICSVKGCSRKVHCEGFCLMHYTRVLRTGNTEALIRPRSTSQPYASDNLAPNRLPNGVEASIISLFRGWRKIT